MLTFHNEAALLSPVRRSLQYRGFAAQREEVQFFEYSIDLYAFDVRADSTVAVELKLAKWMRAFEQALIYQLCADRVYLALPMAAARKVDRPLLEEHGLGLIGVQPGPRCKILLPAAQSTVVMPSYRRFYIDLVKGVYA